MRIRRVVVHSLEALSEFVGIVLRELPRLVWLNILFWGVGLAVVTINPSVTGMLLVLRKHVTEDRPETTLTGYWDGMTTRFSRSLFAGSGHLIFTIFTAFVTRFYLRGARGGQAWMYLPFVIFLALLVLLIWYGFYLLLLLTTDLPARYILRAALMPVFRFPVTNLIATILLGAFALFFYHHPFLAIGWYLLIGFALSGLIIAYVCWPIVQRYILDPYALERTSDPVNQAGDH